MAQPQSEQVEHARGLIVELGRLLSDITSGRAAGEVHERLLDIFDAAEHDSRVDAMEVGRREFAAVWDAIQGGRALPEAAWEQVVLPTVVAFSSPQQEKVRLERATSFWLAASAAVAAVPDYPAAVAALAAAPAVAAEPSAPAAASAVPEAPLRSPAVAEAAPAPVIDLDEPRRARHGLRRARSGPDRRVLVAVSVAVVATVAVMVVLLNGRGGGGQPMSVQDGMPSPGLSSGVATGESGEVTLPTAPPTASAAPLPMKTGEPTPVPTWSPPAPTGGATPRPPQPPTAPRNLAAVASDQLRVWLSWSPPADAGSGGVSYYEVRRGGAMIGWSTTTSVTVGHLTPGTTYTFWIVAINGAGLRSPASNLVTVTTASWPTSPPPTSPDAPSPSEPPSPTPSPEPSTAEPSPSPSEPASPSPEESSPDPEPGDPGDGL